MTFFNGNDFIPNLPNMQIDTNGVLVVLEAYKKIIQTLDGYINLNGYLNLSRFQKFLNKLSEHDMESFRETFADLAFLEGKCNQLRPFENDVNLIFFFFFFL